MRLFAFNMALLAWLMSHVCYAATTELEPLDFGTIVIPKNTNTSSLIIKDDGSHSTQGHIFVLDEGHPAELLLSDLPPYAEVNMYLVNSVTVEHNAQGSTSANFEVRLNGFPKGVITDANGDAVVKIGGTLISQPSSKSYADGNYSSTTQLEISIDY